MFYATADRDRTKLPRDPFKAIVAPRPIGWISTRALDGRINLAPYSFFNGFCSVAADRRLLQRRLEGFGVLRQGKRRVRRQPGDVRSARAR